MNGINAPKVVECLGSDGHEYRQLAKSGNDDLRQDAVSSLHINFCKRLHWFHNFHCYLVEIHMFTKMYATKERRIRKA